MAKDQFRLYLGDCLDILPKLGDASVDFIFTDPPYGHGNNDGDLIANREKAFGPRRGDHGRGGKNAATYEARPIANDRDGADPLFRKALAHFPRLLRKGGCCAVCCGGGGGKGVHLQYARWSRWIDRQEDLEFKQMIVWDKGPMGMGWHYRRSYETVLVAQRVGAPCKWYDTTGKIENIIRPGAYGIKKVIPGEGEHPTPKPISLIMHFLRLHTKPGDVVLDPFMGGGSTAIACKELGRKFIGIEIDRVWHQYSKERIANHQPTLIAQQQLTRTNRSFGVEPTYKKRKKAEAKNGESES